MHACYMNSFRAQQKSHRVFNTYINNRFTLFAQLKAKFSHIYFIIFKSDMIHDLFISYPVSRPLVPVFFYYYYVK